MLQIINETWCCNEENPENVMKLISEVAKAQIDLINYFLINYSLKKGYICNIWSKAQLERQHSHCDKKKDPFWDLFDNTYNC